MWAVVAVLGGAGSGDSKHAHGGSSYLGGKSSSLAAAHPDRAPTTTAVAGQIQA